MATSLKISYPKELIPELMSKVVGHSTLAKLSNQIPIPFSGIEQFVFNLEGNAQIVGEGEQKLAGQATTDPKIIKPMKFVYQARFTDEFMYASDEKKVDYYSRFADGFSKIIAKSFDIAAIHGLEPKSMTDASFKATNSFDGTVTENVITFNAATIETDLETAVQTVIANDADVTGIALSPTAGQALAKVEINGVKQFPEFRFGQNPDSFFGMSTDINKTLVAKKGGTAKVDHAIVGDFQNMFKWGYAQNIPMEVIEFGDPDGTGRDLKAFNEVCLRAEAFIGWGILDTKSFARIEAGA